MRVTEILLIGEVRYSWSGLAVRMWYPEPANAVALNELREKWDTELKRIERLGYGALDSVRDAIEMSFPEANAIEVRQGNVAALVYPEWP